MEILISLNLEKYHLQLYTTLFQETVNFVGALKQYDLFQEVLQKLIDCHSTLYAGIFHEAG